MFTCHDNVPLASIPLKCPYSNGNRLRLNLHPNPKYHFLPGKFLSYVRRPGSCVNDVLSRRSIGNAFLYLLLLAAMNLLNPRSQIPFQTNFISKHTMFKPSECLLSWLIRLLLQGALNIYPPCQIKKIRKIN